jgi:hypothetical protein
VSEPRTGGCARGVIRDESGNAAMCCLRAVSIGACAPPLNPGVGPGVLSRSPKDDGGVDLTPPHSTKGCPSTGATGDTHEDHR